MAERTVSVLEGSTFVVGDRNGDVRRGGGREHGFFSDDTRFVSHWELRVDSTPLTLLGLDQRSHFLAQFFLTPDIVDPSAEAPYSVMRRRLLDQVWTEQVTIVSHRHETSEIAVRLVVDTDFADLFEVKDGVDADRDITWHQDEAKGSLTLSYAHGGFERAVTICSDPPARHVGGGLAYTLMLAPGESWTATFTLTPRARQPGARFVDRTAARGSLEAQYTTKTMELEAWLAQAPALETDDAALARTYRASLTDLAALRLHPDLGEAATLPAAGLPWFMALFGRDSILTSYQALPYLPELAATTLRVLAARQATTRDDFHEQEPGKILHELRFGELTADGRRPHSPYFGSADATPLFLVLLDEYHRWTGDAALVRALEPHARAALSWIDDSGDIDGDGYVEYSRRNAESGLLNQCWKDSWDSMQFADGTLAQGPIATCEIQGYVYDARRRCARLAREVWDDPELARRLDAQADALRDRVRQDFWIPERGCHALALDGDKRQVDALTSNIGHLLWSGLLSAEEAAVTADRLLGEELSSGWGVRTLGCREGGYNPLGYHTGTVWPHENSLIVAGLARYGLDDAAGQIGGAILSAAPYFEHRLPEVFAGYPAEVTGVPVAFPTASRPQAWAAGAPLLLLTTLLGLEPGHAPSTAALPATGVPGTSSTATLHRERIPV
ncbi:amylo-alpha-1,6-glucosidase [Baekduia sp. Peel2402]|uniref:amylo-alpha-1,6-glucosidase n=1 Tax=Baekduia sp. Peel2402 TaxID=3458296 RepID=UPI00403E54EC